ncbi:acyclic terpene utilization AtuA family protein [Botrimarina sp.]|uniref:acyclic terpene utilization AtuA family protein n=1 Tax=Botrimarina sp. TaxID=2795802 RepID=UPI0032EE1E16
MPDPPPDADATWLRLFLGMAADGVVAPRSLIASELGDLTLELSADRPAVALSKLRTLGRALGPTLYVQPDTQLRLVTGELSPAQAAREFCRAQVAGGNDGVRIGVVRGEGVLDRLEEFLAAGCDLDGERSLRDAGRQPAAAWAQAGAGVVDAAFGAGASVVVSRRPVRTSHEPGTTPVEVVFVTEHRVQAPWSAFEALWPRASTGQGEAVDAELAASIGLGVRVELIDTGGERQLCVAGVSEPGVRAAARRIELLATPGALSAPLESGVAPVIRRERLRTPTSLLEFFVDTRGAAEWAEA